MELFVRRDSVVREIWGKSDTILFIFAGAAAEFALNKAVDWLYFTGRLPADPLGRLFSTVAYARLIVFAPADDAHRAISKMRAIHTGVEQARGAAIPDWAYHDVLFMLIHYSIAAQELLERKLSRSEKEEVFQVFYRVGSGMGLKDLPENYDDWLLMRNQHMNDHLVKSAYTSDLFRQYKKHLGLFRYLLLREAQIMVVPQRVRKLLGLRSFSLLQPAVPLYRFSRFLRMHWLIRSALLPKAYKTQIDALDKVRS